ncbi:hypothetical protein DL93DRAFT_1109307 [Clavulina sp. PMI_390]|nr:hypothetical protein DL93DRAFT_1109307 [Clavulina sp. PMI_390]
MPNEILVHICSYLYPNDLLHLTQSSKMFALLLLAPSSSHIWHSSRVELDSDMPARPNDLSEQQYCSLIFGLYCQRCGVACRSTSKSVVWMLRRRWCEKCRMQTVTGKNPDYAVYRWGWNTRGLVSVGVLWFGTRNRADVVYKPELEAIETLAETDGVSEDMRDGYKRDVDERQEHANLIEKWMTAYAQERSGLSSDLRSQRIEDLKNFLQAEGYFRPLLDFIPQSDYLELPSMKAAKPLSLRGWNMCKAKVLPLMGNVMNRSTGILATMAIKFAKLKYESYYQPFLPSKAFFPVRIEEVPQIKATMTAWIEDPDVMAKFIAQQMECDLPIPEEITTSFPVYVSENRQVLESYFLGCLPFHDRLISEKTPEEILNLAVSVFHSTKAADFPIISRRHANLPFHVVTRRQQALPFVDGRIDPAGLSNQWFFDSVASSIISTIVRSLDLDVDQCTHDEVEAADCFVSCLLCEMESGYATMHWEQAVHHWYRSHENRSPSDAIWKILTADEKHAAIIPWARSRGIKNDFTLPNGEAVIDGISYDCALCPEALKLIFLGTSNTLPHHMQHSHKITGDAAYDAQYRVRNRCMEAWPTVGFPFPEPPTQ